MSALPKFESNVFQFPRRGGGDREGNCPVYAIAAFAAVIARDNRHFQGSANFIHRFIEVAKESPNFPHDAWDSMVANVEAELAVMLDPRRNE